MSDEKIDISRALKSAITTGKVEFGVEQTKKAVKEGKAPCLLNLLMQALPQNVQGKQRVRLCGQAICKEGSEIRKESPSQPSCASPPPPHNRGRIQSLSLRVRPTPPLPPSGHWWNCRASSSWIGLRGRACLCSTGQTHLWILPTPAAPTHTQRQLSGHHFRNLRAVKLGMPGR